MLDSSTTRRSAMLSGILELCQAQCDAFRHRNAFLNHAGLQKVDLFLYVLLLGIPGNLTVAIQIA